MGTLSILNAGLGDVKITFDKNNAAEKIRAERIITDMIKRGAALLVEVNGEYRRVKKFDAKNSEYIIADYALGGANEEKEQNTTPKRKVGRPAKIPTDEGKAIVVARSAGG